MQDEAEFVARQPTLDPAVAGFLCGVGRNSSYKAAKRGDIPVIEIGNLLRVPTAKLAAQLGMTDAQIAQAVALATAKLGEMRQRSVEREKQRPRGSSKSAAKRADATAPIAA